MIERVLKAMVTEDMTVTPIEAMFDTDAEKIVCYREIEERNGVFVNVRDGEWITPKKDFKYMLFSTFKEAADYADTERQELQKKLDELKDFVAKAERVFPGELKKIIKAL